jgi:hypothetical protein
MSRLILTAGHQFFYLSNNSGWEGGADFDMFGAKVHLPCAIVDGAPRRPVGYTEANRLIFLIL